MSTILGGTRPDLTPAQLIGVLVAGVPVVANLLRAFGLFDATPEQEQALQDALSWGAVLAGLLFVSDAGLRAARNAADAKRDAAALAPVAPAVPAAPAPFGPEDDLAAFAVPAASAVPDAPEIAS